MSSDLSTAVSPLPLARAPVAGARVVVVDKRAERRALMTRVVELSIGTGSVVAQTADGPESVAAVDNHGANIALVEVQLPTAVGLAIIAELRAAYPLLLIVVCTFLADRATQEQAREAGADMYLVKPVSARQLRESLVCDALGHLLRPAVG